MECNPSLFFQGSDGSKAWADDNDTETNPNGKKVGVLWCGLQATKGGGDAASGPTGWDGHERKDLADRCARKSEGPALSAEDGGAGLSAGCNAPDFQACPTEKGFKNATGGSPPGFFAEKDEAMGPNSDDWIYCPSVNDPFKDASYRKCIQDLGPSSTNIYEPLDTTINEYLHMGSEHPISNIIDKLKTCCDVDAEFNSSQRCGSYYMGGSQVDSAVKCADNNSRCEEAKRKICSDPRGLREILDSDDLDVRNYCINYCRDNASECAHPLGQICPDFAPNKARHTCEWRIGGRPPRSIEAGQLNLGQQAIGGHQLCSEETCLSPTCTWTENPEIKKGIDNHKSACACYYGEPFYKWYTDTLSLTRKNMSPDLKRYLDSHSSKNPNCIYGECTLPENIPLASAGTCPAPTINLIECTQNVAIDADSINADVNIIGDQTMNCGWAATDSTEAPPGGSSSSPSCSTPPCCSGNEDPSFPDVDCSADGKRLNTGSAAFSIHGLTDEEKKNYCCLPITGGDDNGDDTVYIILIIIGLIVFFAGVGYYLSLSNGNDTGNTGKTSAGKTSFRRRR